jgi:hypothetical protein
MDSLFQDLRDWQPFFSTVTLASATLVGFLFVSLSLYRDRDQTASAAGRFSTAQRSFGDFLYVLMIGLVFLVPQQVPFGLAVALSVFGTARGAGLIPQAALAMPSLKGRGKLGDTPREYAIPAFASIGLRVVGIEVARGATIAIYGLVLVVAALLSTGSWNAWPLLVEA